MFSVSLVFATQAGKLCLKDTINVLDTLFVCQFVSYAIVVKMMNNE